MNKNRLPDHSARPADRPVDIPAESDLPGTMTRRAFMQAVAAGAATLVVTACAGGGSVGGSTGGAAPGPTSSPVSGQSMTWRTVPTITFTQGVPSSISIAGYLDDQNGAVQSITKNAAALPPGVTYDQAGKRFVYDGIGAVGATGGHVLTASDGNP